MASWDDVEAVMADLPEAVEGDRSGTRTWFVDGRAFAWDRPFSKADRKRFGADPAPATEPILALATEDLHDKEAILASGIKGVFTISHFDGYAAILVELNSVTKRSLRTLIRDAYQAKSK
jgi:hypothetical protein